jgi:RimJ/RimL family protein N-acetyltransferase
MRIETERLILRPFILSDENNLYEFQSKPHIVKYIPWPERTQDEVHAALIRALDEGKETLAENGDFMLFAWELRSTGKVIGQSNLSLKSVDDKCGEFGYVTHQDFQRRGYALEASKAILGFAFNSYDLHRIIANIDTRNAGSSALATKLGMRLEGTFREAEMLKGRWSDIWLYAILRTEWNI